MRSTTWKRRTLHCGIEADLSYHFDLAKVAACDRGLARWSETMKEYPDPDLVVEGDISRSKIDRPGNYAALNVAEVWRVPNKQILIEQLQPDGTYAPAARSRFFPVGPEEVTLRVLDEDARGSITWKLRLREWARTELGPRMNV